MGCGLPMADRGVMATTLHPTPRDHAPLATNATGPESPRVKRIGLLASHQTYALFAPLLLFAHGILGWVDSIDGDRSGALRIAGQLALVASMVGFGALAVTLARHGGRADYPASSLGITALGVVIMVLPLELLPLGALLVLIGLGPLTQPVAADPSDLPTGTRPAGQPLS